MREAAPAAFSAPQASCNACSSVQLYVALGTASGLSATTSPGRAAYNREAHVGQHTHFVKGAAGGGEKDSSDVRDAKPGRQA